VFQAAVVQMSSGPDREANEARAAALIGQAADRGAKLVGLPEMFEHIGPAAEAFAGPVHANRAILKILEVCKDREIWVLAGSVAELAPDGRIYNTSTLISPRGEIAAQYRKIHLFDVDIPDGVRYRESDQVAPGTAPAPTVDILGLKIGLTVCYDLRFPELYRALGADVLCVPAAFTAYTGRAHWEVLLRARAIENQAYVFAPAQVGRIGPAKDNRHAWGHACIVDPWGEVVADAGGESEGIAMAAIDEQRLAQVRRDLPSLKHRRLVVDAPPQQK